MVKRLHSEGRLAVEDVPIRFGPKVYGVNTEPVHPTGKAFGNPKRAKETPFVVNVKLDAKSIRTHTRQLLHRYDRDPAEEHLRTAG